MESKKTSRSSHVIAVAAILMLLLFVAAGLTAYYLGKNVGLFQGNRKPENEKPAINDSSSQQVIIIGAGISGISAAKTLHEAGIPSLILEAKSKIGGRIHELNFSGTVIEGGASWIHGSKGNPIKEIADKINLTGIISNYEDYTCLNATGNDVTNALDEAYERFTPRFEKVKAMGSRAHKNVNVVDMSLRSALTQAGWHKTKDVDNVVEFFDMDFENGDIAERTSLKYAADLYTYRDFGEDEFFVTDQRGYAEIVRYLASQFLAKKDKRLKLSETVSSIEYHKKGVKVKTNKGVYSGTFALSTVSLGVLQHDIIKFEPLLPGWKRAAIHKHVMGDAVYVFFKFAKSFWHGTEHTLLANLRYGFYPIFMNLKATKQFPVGTNIIFMTVLANEARRISKLPDRVIKHEIMTLFRKLYGKNITDPVDFVVMKWSSDPRFFGAWSNWPFGLSRDEFKAFKAPVGRVYFGGEATSERYFGYTHGAYLSGIEQANQIIKCIKGDCESYVPNFLWPK